MSKNYEKIKNYYDKGLWSKTRVKNMVVKGIITADEYQLIVGEDVGDISTGGGYSR